SHSGDQRDRASPKPCQLTENGPCGAPRTADSSLLCWPEIAPMRVTPGLIPNFQIAGKRRSFPHFPAKPNAHWAQIVLPGQALASSSRTTGGRTLVVPDLMRHIALFAVHPAIQTMLPGFGASA